MNTKQEQAEGRVARRQRRVRDALLEAAGSVMSEKGVDSATMLEIAARADVGAGTIYNYFKSKDELAVAVLEEMMYNLALRIEAATKSFDDPAQVYAYGIRVLLETATKDIRWKQLLSRSEVIADALYSRMGPFAVRDLRLASKAGRIPLSDPELVWRMATYVIVGISLTITSGNIPEKKINEAVVHLLGMTGIGIDAARELASRRRPVLPQEP